MTTWHTPVVFVGAGLLTAALTGAVRSYAVHGSVLDKPNARSLHRRVVPRGGGLAIAITFLLSTLLLAAAAIVNLGTTAALVGGGLMVSAVGWLDDVRGGIPASTRLIVHTAAAAWALLWLGGFQQLQLGTGAAQLGFLGNGLALLGIVWVINLFNFMDGIDGIAAGEAATVFGFAALMLLSRGDTPNAMLALILAGAAGGFLCWNWQPARIFMGDVGSGFLGYTLAVLALSAERAGTLPVVAWLILFGVFIVDATVTLLRRIARGERFYTAHRKHAYQRLVMSGWEHWQVTLAVVSINCLLAAIAWFGQIDGRYLLPSAVTCFMLLLAAYFVIELRSPFEATAQAG